MISLRGTDTTQKRHEIKAYFNETYDQYERLFDYMAGDDAFYHRPERLRHPLIFYFGHTATFFVNKLVIAKVIDARIDPEMESIFAVGVDEMSWDDLNEKHYAWPGVAETRAYRDKVRELVNGLIDTMPLTLPIGWESPFWAVLMGIEHERIHLETSSVLMRQLPLELVKEGAWQVCEDAGEAPENELLVVPGAKVQIGKSREDDYYSWDNEYGFHEAEIPDFFASKYLVSNGEFLAFVRDGGYEADIFWEEEGLAWRNYTDVKHPPFWVAKEDGFWLRHIDREVPLPLNHPVDVNYHEAKAFCNWLSQREGKQYRLPAEDEWYRLADVAGIGTVFDDKRANTNLAHYISSVPVDRFRQGDFYDVTGNLWQWTETPIYPFEGFEVHPWYDDFSTPTFDGRHNLIKGGSFISTGNEILKSARYAFRRHFYQHAGFRYVESSYEEQIKANVYESDAQIAQYAEFGWGESAFGIENYPSACVRHALSFMKRKPKRRALDVGCAIGRSTFELAREFGEVTGLDFTARFISLATRMKEEGRIGYAFPVEGELVAYKQAALKDFGLEDEAQRVQFWQADACNLKPHFRGYDLIFAGNLIDRLYDPAKFLGDLHERLVEGGLLILTSPYTWLEEFTPKEKWLGGFKKDGEDFTTLDGLKAVLGEHFTLLHTRDIPFVLKETARKHQHTIAQMTVWEKSS
ncbi:MAG: SAM-dependent methyltransferase [Sulfurospirillum sp.]|nr:MAG: SAM-dependent methyltransferase [Sulfurospirillum sp.]